MRIDCYGNETDVPYCEWCMKGIPLESKYKGRWTYMRFTAGTPCVIHRLGVETDDGLISETWAYGPWKQAERLDYIPLSTTLEIK